MSLTKVLHGFPLTIAAIAILSMGFARSAGAEVIYTEDFYVTESGLLNEVGVGWDYVIDYTPPAGLPSVSSTAGYDSQPGLVTTSKVALGGHALVYTTEAAVDRSQNSNLVFSWYMGNNSTAPYANLAIQIGGSWYVSENAFYQIVAMGSAGSFPTAAEFNSIALSAVSAWNVLTVGENTLAVGTEAVSLPTTPNAISGMGLLFCAGTGVDKQVRFDQYQVTGDVVPEPSTTMMLLGGIAGLLAYAWRKQR